MHDSVFFVVILDARSRELGNSSVVHVRMVNVLMLLLMFLTILYMTCVSVCACDRERVGRHQDIFLVHFIIVGSQSRIPTF